MGSPNQSSSTAFVCECSTLHSIISSLPGFCSIIILLLLLSSFCFLFLLQPSVLFPAFLEALCILTLFFPNSGVDF